MKFQPIEKPHLAGCLNCSPVPEKTLDKDERLYPEVMDGITIYLGERNFYDCFNEEEEKNGFTLNELESKNKDIIEKSDAIVIEFQSGLHSEKYELNKEDGNWYLVEQGQGWA